MIGLQPQLQTVPAGQQLGQRAGFGPGFAVGAVDPGNQLLQPGGAGLKFLQQRRRSSAGFSPSWTVALLHRRLESWLIRFCRPVRSCNASASFMAKSSIRFFQYSKSWKARQGFGPDGSPRNRGKDSPYHLFLRWGFVPEGYVQIQQVRSLLDKKIYN